MSLCVYLWAELGLSCCVGFALVAVQRLLTVVASLVVEPWLCGMRASVIAALRLRSYHFQAPEHRLSSCGPWA